MFTINFLNSFSAQYKPGSSNVSSLFLEQLLLDTTCIINMGMVIMYIVGAKWINIQDPSLNVVLLMTLSLYFMQMVQLKCLTYRFSQPSPSCARAVWHSHGLLQSCASTIGTLSHSYDWACHFDSVTELLWPSCCDSYRLTSHETAQTSSQPRGYLHSHSN